MHRFHRWKMLFFLMLLGTPALYAQDLDSLLNVSAYTEESDLQKVLNKGLKVSSAKAMTTRETPGIISLVTAEEIRNSGARDLIDILRMVPGFDVAQDLQFVIGIGLRGSWANEGKVLVMMDGQPFNELLYQTVAIGNRFPVDAIERIEIIRGPGSAIYGGSAEYGVINIVTKAAESLNGVAVYGTGGFHADATGRSNGGLMIGQKNETFSWDASFYKGNGIVSDNKQYQDLYQTNVPQNLAKTTHADPMNLNIGLQYAGLSVRAMMDEFQTSDPFVFIKNRNYFADVSYAAKIGEKITLTPRIRYMNQVPWSYGDVGADYDFRVRAERISGQLDATFDVSRKVNISAGAIYFKDKGTDLLDQGEFDGSKTMELNNYALYTQALFKHRLFNATVGFRHEKNNRYGSAFVPRAALTKKIQNFHFKLLYSEAFRAPSLQNINKALGGVIKPEKSNVIEMELGYQFTPEMLLSFNAFNIKTRNILVYGSEGEGEDFTEWYTNASKSGSKGLEAIYSIRRKKWYSTVTYSFSQALKDNTVETYMTPQTSKQYIGLAMNKITANVNMTLIENLNMNTSIIHVGKRYGYTAVDDNELPVATEIDPYTLVNLFFNYQDAGAKGLNLGLGVFDLFNSKPVIPQAYNGGFAPIPGRSREYVVKVSYQLNFKNK